MKAKEALKAIIEEVGSGSGFEGYEVGEIIKRFSDQVKEESCQGCSFWRQTSHKSSTGSCQFVKLKKDSVFSGCGLITEKTFGCSEFKSK